MPYKEQSTVGFKHLIMFILTLMRVTDKILSCGMPITWLHKSKWVLLLWTLKDQLAKKLLMKIGRLPFSLTLPKSLWYHVSKLFCKPFLKSKNIAIKCSFLMKAFLLGDSSWISWSVVLSFFLKPDGKFVFMFLVSKNQVSLLLMILSRVLHKQLVRIGSLKDFLGLFQILELVLLWLVSRGWRYYHWFMCYCRFWGGNLGGVW